MAVLMLGCTQASNSPTAPSALASMSAPSLSESQSSERCLNISLDVTAALGFIEVAPGVFTLGALPTPVTLGDIPGVIGSVVTSAKVGGATGQGAQHFTLQLSFQSTDPSRAGTFLTENKAVCAPAGSDPNVCTVNDVMQMASGTGIFSNADGSLRAHGVIDLNNFTIQVRLTGRVCGDGL
jgi:hypothetical protein